MKLKTRNSATCQFSYRQKVEDERAEERKAKKIWKWKEEDFGEITEQMRKGTETG